MMFQDVFSDGGIPNCVYAEEESKVTEIVIKYTNRGISPQAVSEEL